MSENATVLVTGGRPVGFVRPRVYNYRSKPIVLFFALFLLILFPAKSLAADVEVGTVGELQDAVTNASEGDVITLSNSFVFGEVSLLMPTVNVTIDGGDKVWNIGTFRISGAGDKTLTIKNLKVDGATATKRLLYSTATNGKLVLERMEFYNSSFGALDMGTGVDASTVVSYTRIYNNTANNTAPAVWVSGYSKVAINNCTIENNIGTGAGYEC